MCELAFYKSKDENVNKFNVGLKILFTYACFSKLPLHCLTMTQKMY